MGLSSALATAMSGLRANQAALSIMSSNIANAQTPGYVTQNVNQIEVASGGAGSSVQVTGVNRQLDLFVQSQLRTETSGGGYADQTVEYPGPAAKRLRDARRHRHAGNRVQQFYLGAAGAVDEFGQPVRADHRHCRRRRRWRSN